MQRFKTKDKIIISKVMDKFIYPSQFKNETGLIYHIINFCYPLLKSDSKIEYFINVYTKSNSTTATTNYYKLMENFDKSKATIFRLDCFTHLQEILEPEDYIYLHGYRRRITLKEIKYLAHRITRHVYKSSTGEVVIANAYFKTEGFKKEYEKNTNGRKFGDRKFANILKVLTKHKYLFVKRNSKNHNIYMIGENNPYYLLHEVKDIDEKVKIVKTSLEKKVEDLEKENAELKKMFDANRFDYLEAEDCKKEKEQWETRHNEVFELCVEKEKELMSLQELKDRPKWSICSKPVVRQNDFEKNLNNIIFGEKKVDW